MPMIRLLSLHLGDMGKQPLFMLFHCAGTAGQKNSLLLKLEKLLLSLFFLVDYIGKGHALFEEHMHKLDDSNYNVCMTSKVVLYNS